MLVGVNRIMHVKKNLKSKETSKYYFMIIYF